MKKLLSVFALMATILMGAVTLTSCDEEDIVAGGGSVDNKFHHYVFTLSLDTRNVEVANSEKFIEANKEMASRIKNRFGSSFYTSRTEAEKTWRSWDSQLDQEYQEARDLAATYFEDPTITLTLNMLEDNRVWKSRTWSEKR